MWPGRARSSATVDPSMSACTVVLRSAAEMPVDVPRLGVDRDRERGALPFAVVGAGDHQRQLELVEPRTLERQADHATRVADHERHLLGRHLLGRDDEVALVLAVFVVDHDDELTARDRVDRFFDPVNVMVSAPLLLGTAAREPLDVLRDEVDFEVDARGRSRSCPAS